MAPTASDIERAGPAEPADFARGSLLTDEELVREIVAGRTALFEIVMRRHNERLYRAARAILRDDAEAEDVMQQAYVNAYAHLEQFDGQAAFATWLTRIAVYEALSRVRRRQRLNLTDAVIEDQPMPLPSSSDPEQQAMTRELGTLLEAAIEQLPDGSREVFVLRAVQGLSTADTAGSLDISEDAVKTRFSRAKAMLRRDLAERAGILAPTVFAFQAPRCDRVVAAVLARISHRAASELR
jgi:RNA polymerase sigma-70 factor (ECF subfamily)